MNMMKRRDEKEYGGQKAEEEEMRNEKKMEKKNDQTGVKNNPAFYIISIYELFKKASLC
jgi:hypothetical protein